MEDKTFIKEFLKYEEVCRECGGKTNHIQINKVDSYFKILAICSECKTSYLIGEGNLPDEEG